MSGSQATLTVPSPPTTAEVAADIGAWIGGQTGVITDFNVGSQVRTESEATGSVVEMQSVIAQAQAFEAMVKGAWAAFNVIPQLALQSVGTVTFTTGLGANPPSAPSPIVIGAGTVVQTVGGIQFETTATVTIPTGSTSIAASVEAVVAGAGGNVAGGAITQIASGLSYPLQVTNSLPTTGGEDAETPAETMARFTAIVAAVGLATPVAVANGAMGASVSGTSETVKFATCYEPWIDQAAQGVVNPTPGFDLYVDNGSGSASSNLLAAVSTVLSGNQATGKLGFRPAGVPYNVFAVSPVPCTVVVVGNAVDIGLDAQLDTLASTAVNGYFSTLPFGQAAESSQLIAAVANQVAGSVNTLDVQLLNVSGVVVNSIQPLGFQRVILNTLSVTFS